jgi:hypothetical protein
MRSLFALVPFQITQSPDGYLHLTPNDGVTIAASWNALVNDKPEDNIHEDYWFLNRLKNGEGFLSVDGGDVITGSIEYALNGTVQWYSDTETISTTRQDVFDRFEYSWKEIAGTVLQSELESAINQGSAAKFDLKSGKLSNLRSTFDNIINASLYADGTGTGGKEIGGLQALVPNAPTSGTVGGINAGTFSFWRSQQTSGVKSTSAFDNLRATMRSIYNLCSNGVAGKHPTFVSTTRTVFEGFEGLLLANERFTSKDQADGGFKNEVVKFKGALMAYDNDCPTGNAYFLNAQYIKLAYAKGHWYKASPGVSPANQTVDVFKVHSIANLIATNRRMLGVVTAIT